MKHDAPGELDRLRQFAVDTLCDLLRLPDNKEMALRAITEVGIDLNRPATDGRTALVTACTLSERVVVQALLDNGADPNQPDGRGQLPLIISHHRGNTHFVGPLIAAGADPRLKGSDRNTFLEYFEAYADDAMYEESGAAVRAAVARIEAEKAIAELNARSPRP